MASFIMAGRAQAAIFIVLSTLISLVLPPLGLFSGAAIALITLRISWQQGVIYSLLGSAVLAIAAYFFKQEVVTGILAGLIGWLPLVFFSTLLKQTHSWERTLQAILMFSIASVFIFHLYQSDSAVFWQSILEQIKPAIKEAYQLDNSQTKELIEKASTLMTGVFIAMMSIASTLALLLARHWQAMLYNLGGFGKEFRQLRIGKNPAILMVACIIVALFSSSTLIVEILIIAVGIFMLQGIALAHGIVNQLEMKPFWLVGLYVLLFFLLVQMIVLLAAFGIIDNFVDFRRKIASKTKLK